MEPQISIKHNIGNTITIPNQLDVKTVAYLNDNIASGVLAVPVDNAVDFTVGDILLLLSSIGNESAEIIKSTSHTNTSFTTLATVMAHNRGDTVKEIKYDQIVVSKSTTMDGVYAELETKTFFVTQQNTIIFDSTGLSTDYYKIQWKNSITGELSTASSPMSVSAYPTNSVANIIFPVLRAMGVSENDSKITVEFCLSAVDDARKYTEAKLYGIRHAWQQSFEYPIKLLAGTNSVDLPTDIDYNETDRSVLAARLIVSGILTPFNLSYIDKRSWNQVSYCVAGGLTSSEVLTGATSINLDSVGDFPDSTTGVAYVATSDYSQTIMEISYTSVDYTTNQLLGVTGITRDIPSGTRVWSRPTIAQPTSYTVYSDKLVFDRIIPDSMQGSNLYIDYYKKMDVVTDLSQELPEHYREIYKWYLRYAIKYRKDISLDNSDPDLKKFEELVLALFENLYTGQTTTIITS
jgi:hypothetical protein